MNRAKNTQVWPVIATDPKGELADAIAASGGKIIGFDAEHYVLLNPVDHGPVTMLGQPRSGRSFDPTWGRLSAAGRDAIRQAVEERRQGGTDGGRDE